jgi:hypothetical protein
VGGPSKFAQKTGGWTSCADSSARVKLFKELDHVALQLQTFFRPSKKRADGCRFLRLDAHPSLTHGRKRPALISIRTEGLISRTASYDLVAHLFLGPVDRAPVQGILDELQQEVETMQVALADAIQQLRDELREAILEGRDKDIIFTPNGIELELGLTFVTEAKAGGGFKLLAFLDLSAEGKASRESQHRIKLSLSVADKNGHPIKVRSETVPKGVPR